MVVKPIKTRLVESNSCSIFDVLDESLGELAEGSIIAISSKIVSLCEGRAVAKSVNKGSLVKQESDFFLPKKVSQYGLYLTLSRNTLIPNAGIDESNANNLYVLWPKDPQKTANAIRGWVVKKYGIKRVGVIITDSFCVSMRLGTIGIALAHSGFKAVENYIGKPDLFDRKLIMSQAGIAGGLAAAAVLTMGEGAQQTPLAIIEDIPFVAFQDRDPTNKELGQLQISREDDLYSPLLNSVEWLPGERN